MSKELRSLLVSAETVAEDTLVHALGGAVSIIEGHWRSHGFTWSFQNGSFRSNNCLSIRIESGCYSRPKANRGGQRPRISTTLHLDLQRVRETLSRLKNTVVAKTDNGYQIPIVRTATACELLTSKRSKS
jgi:hypothetical protein